ncbi:MAG: hypothetical protein WC732_08530 [Candidatus Omnitrophota bacterium]
MDFSSLMRTWPPPGDDHEWCEPPATVPDRMSFPRDQWAVINERLLTREWCSTTRVDDEYDRWSEVDIGHVCDSDVGPIRIVEKLYLTDALRDHPYRTEVECMGDQLAGKPGLFIGFIRAAPSPICH